MVLAPLGPCPNDDPISSERGKIPTRHSGDDLPPCNDCGVAGVLVFDCDFASNLRFLQQCYCDRSVTVDPQKWGTRSSRSRLLENAAGLLSPLL